MVSTPPCLRLCTVAVPPGGPFPLGFSAAPLALGQWQLTDGQGVTTTVTLTDVRTGMPLDAKLFRFREPEFR